MYRMGEWTHTMINVLHACKCIILYCNAISTIIAIICWPRSLHQSKCHEALPPPHAISSRAMMWLGTGDQSTVKRCPLVETAMRVGRNSVPA